MGLIASAAVYTALATTGSSCCDGRSPTQPVFYLGGNFYAASFATFLAALRRFEVLSVVPLFTGVTYATVAAAAVVLDESLTPSRLVGIALVCVGAMLLLR